MPTTVVIDGQAHTAPTVAELRAAGFKMRTRHRRIAYGMLISKPPYGWSYAPSPDTKGGQTDVTLFAPNGTFAHGSCKCAETDPFNKRTGYTLAMERAMEELALHNKERITIGLLHDVLELFHLPRQDQQVIDFLLQPPEKSRAEQRCDNCGHHRAAHQFRDNNTIKVQCLAKHHPDDAVCGCTGYVEAVANRL